MFVVTLKCSSTVHHRQGAARPHISANSGLWDHAERSYGFECLLLLPSFRPSYDGADEAVTLWASMGNVVSVSSAGVCSGESQGVQAALAIAPALLLRCQQC